MAELKIDPSKTALIVIDLQKGIVGMPTEPRNARQVVENAARLLAAFRDAGAFVVIVRVAGAPDGRDILHPVCDAPMVGERPADWAEIVPELGMQSRDHLVTKKQWGAFYGTDLDLQLRRRKRPTLVLCGIATCFGVESTARDAYERGYDQVFAEDAMASRTAAEHEHAISRIFPRMGLVRSTADVLKALEGHR